MTALDYLCAEYKKTHDECSREVIEQVNKRPHSFFHSPTACGQTDLFHPIT
jgi:hypothetical protein